MSATGPVRLHAFFRPSITAPLYCCRTSAYAIAKRLVGRALFQAKRQENCLAPRIQWASTLVVLITHDTAQSWWVNWEIEQAVAQGKNVVGVFAQGATDADIPAELQKCGDAAIVGWQGERVVDAINGKNHDWDDPQTGAPRQREWVVKRYSC
jgi:hypothetical protein